MKTIAGLLGLSVLLQPDSMEFFEKFLEKKTLVGDDKGLVSIEAEIITC